LYALPILVMALGALHRKRWWRLVDDLRTFPVATDAPTPSGNGEISSGTQASISIGSNGTVTLASPAAPQGMATTFVPVPPCTQMVDQEVGKVKGSTKEELNRARKARNQKRYVERKKMRLAQEAAADASDTR